jgi:predicted lysophospholipase L1 biosynthesis ABC-type transport system permease subunit
MTPKRIVKLFFYQGITIGIIGIVIGTILGVLLALNIEAVIGVIESILGFQFFPKDVFYISRFPSEIHLDDVIMVAIGAFILVVLASIYPAKRAGKLQISKVLSCDKSALLIITLPVVGWSMPPNKFSKVDLPQPDCPIIANDSAGLISKLSAFNTGVLILPL